MKIRLLTFEKPVSPSEARDLDGIDKWHDRASNSSMSGISLDVVGHAVMSDDNCLLRTLFVCDGGLAAIDFAMGPDDLDHLIELLTEAKLQMTEAALSAFVDGLSDNQAQEITDILGGLMTAGASETAES